MSKIDGFDKQLTALWNRDFSRGWLKLGTVSVYFRRCYHVIDGAMVPCLDIANVNVVPPSKGKFTELLDWLEIDFMPRTGGTIFLENVINERLRPYLLRRGYTKDDKFQHYRKKVEKRATD